MRCKACFAFLAVNDVGVSEHAHGVRSWSPVLDCIATLGKVLAMLGLSNEIIGIGSCRQRGKER